MSDTGILDGIRKLETMGNNTWEAVTGQYGKEVIESYITSGTLVKSGEKILLTDKGKRMLSPVEKQDNRFNDGQSQLLFD